MYLPFPAKNGCFHFGEKTGSAPACKNIDFPYFFIPFELILPPRGLSGMLSLSVPKCCPCLACVPTQNIPVIFPPALSLFTHAKERLMGRAMDKQAPLSDR